MRCLWQRCRLSMCTFLIGKSPWRESRSNCMLCTSLCFDNIAYRLVLPRGLTLHRTQYGEHRGSQLSTWMLKDVVLLEFLWLWWF